MDLLNWGSFGVALLALAVSVPRLASANGSSRFLVGLMVIAVATALARLDTVLLQVGWLRAGANMAIALTILWLVRIVPIRRH